MTLSPLHLVVNWPVLTIYIYFLLLRFNFKCLYLHVKKILILKRVTWALRKYGDFLDFQNNTVRYLGFEKLKFSSVDWV